MLGLPAGRYLIREEGREEPSDVLVISTDGEPKPRGRVFGKKVRWHPAREESEDITFPLTTATVIDATPLGEAAEAEKWLAEDVDAEDEVAHAIGVLERAVEAAREERGTSGEYLTVPSPYEAVITRIGYGTGEETAYGRFTDAFSHPMLRPDRQKRELDMDLQVRIAERLSGKRQ